MAKDVIDNVGNNSTQLIDSTTQGTGGMVSPIVEECSSTTNLENLESNRNAHRSDTMVHNENDNSDDMNITSTNTTNMNNESEPNFEINTPRVCESIANTELSNLDDNKGDKEQSKQELDSEIVNEDKITTANNMEVSDEYIDCKNSTVKNSSQVKVSPLVNSLSTLKHLSHLTVKPVIQNKNTPSGLIHEEILDIKKKKCQGENDEESCSINSSTQDEINTKISKSFVDKDPTLDALKVLSKNITVKSLTPTKKNIDDNGSDEEFERNLVKEKPTNAIKLKDVSGNKNITIKKVKLEKQEPLINKIDKPLITPIKIPQVPDTFASEIKSMNTNVDTIQNSNINTKTDILKHLPNIVTKTLPTKKNVPPQLFKETNVSNKTVETEHKEQEVIEISDIDESDDERDHSFKQPESKQDTIIGPLKTLSKHITVKPLNLSPKSIQKNINAVDYDDDNDSFNDDIPNTAKTCSQKLSSSNLALKNALKNLGKNITVKSRNSSPSQSLKSQEQTSQDSYADANDDGGCDSDTDIGQVKIMEIDDQNSGQDENFSNSDNYDEGSDNGPIIESPHDSGSEQGEKDEKDFDFESEIKVSMVHKSNQEISNDKNTVCLSNLSKSITIKSVNTKSFDQQEQPKTSQAQESPEIKNQSKPTPTKLPKQAIKELPNENISSSKNFKNNSKAVDHSSNESSNQKVSVNKEVTVKTFQTKTVIEEITTTVTKTIKTVNQTVKQETRDPNQVNIPVLPQKVIGMRPSTSKSLQGVVIRHAAPVNVRPSNAGPQIRPSSNVVRPSKQIVPMRSPRPNTPRMPITKVNLPKSSPNKQVIGRPLKFSATALMSAPGKRPNAEDVTGPFSCFKKPKESLIPVSDVPSFSGEGVVQVNASSTSNYMTATKTIKGNSVLTAMQTKSEVTSMQQISKYNTTGIKIKNAQVKQTQEKSESSAIKQTTLEAIEKLQKQGLLIKKPRMEENEYSDSEHADDNVGYSSTDEH